MLKELHGNAKGIAWKGTKLKVNGIEWKELKGSKLKGIERS